MKQVWLTWSELSGWVIFFVSTANRGIIFAHIDEFLGISEWPAGGKQKFYCTV
jgi:hypothetical protein